MSYFVMVCEGKNPVTPIQQVPTVKGRWRVGRTLTDPIPEPLVFTLDAKRPGIPKALYYEKSIPVMRDDVAATLRGVGVDNIQYYDAVLRNPTTGEEFRDYKAFNIVGLVACADMGASELMGTSSSSMGDVDFHALVIDESKTHGLYLFRLAEATSAIVVHERVRTAIEAAGIPGFVFYGPGEWSG